ncbi:hypothetical protein LNQ52_12515 [Klebsiella pneumoniae subsp. pneumoniae]|nr:hypothetical protein [Klebsiella pneumoniae subsp. pneumoniae]
MAICRAANASGELQMQETFREKRQPAFVDKLDACGTGGRKPTSPCRR